MPTKSQTLSELRDVYAHADALREWAAKKIEKLEGHKPKRRVKKTSISVLRRNQFLRKAI